MDYVTIFTSIAQVFFLDCRVERQLMSMNLKTFIGKLKINKHPCFFSKKEYSVNIDK